MKVLTIIFKAGALWLQLTAATTICVKFQWADFHDYAVWLICVTIFTLQLENHVRLAVMHHGGEIISEYSGSRPTLA